MYEWYILCRILKVPVEIQYKIAYQWEIGKM